MGSLRMKNILQDYPSMLDKPWKEAAALRLSVRTRKEKEGRRIETIKEISVSPMWQPEYELHASQGGITPIKHWDELEVASIPREAKLYFPQGLRDVWGGPERSHESNRTQPSPYAAPAVDNHAHTPIRNLPTANLFLAEFTVDTTRMPALVHSTSSLEKDVRNFLRSANQFYGLAREPARRQVTGQATSGDCGLNLYTRFEDFMKHPRYHVAALCNTIEEQIEDVDG